jgi:putative nucleotidyltransferase with HDIG domain
MENAMPTVTNCLPGSPSERRQLTYANLISALSFALDLTEGACPGHALRSCILGMKLGHELGLSDELMSDLYYALLLKDVGCSSNAARLFQIVGNDEIRAKRLTKTIDWTRFEWKQMQYLLKQAHAQEPPARRIRNVGSMIANSTRNGEVLIRLRCEQGARVARDLGLNHATAGAIYCLDEHWDVAGFPDRLAGEDIPLLARVLGVAQTLEVFHQLRGPAASIQVLRQRSGRWFDPAIVAAAEALERRGELWEEIPDDALHGFVAALEPRQRFVLADSFIIDNICVAFAGVVDAKSPYTFTHSTGVARFAVQIAQAMGLPGRDITVLRRAGLLHDIGKLSVPNSILDKQGKLTGSEWACVREHPFYTHEILSRISGFEEIARVASRHHEKLDGSGYYLGLRGDDLCLLTRILTVADMFEAMTGERPYRERMSTARALSILRSEAPHALDPRCVEALASVAEDAPLTEVRGVA